MPRINLLPWRETLKQERQLRFVIIALISLAITALVVLGVHLFMEGEIAYQESRNNYLQAEIKKAEAQIQEIEELDKKKQRLIERMNVIQELEESRPQVVHLFDELVKQVPNGVYFTSLTQKGNKVTLEGVAQSDARVSSLMSNFENSQWLTQPKIFFIESKNESKNKKDNKENSRNISIFKLEVTQKAPKTEEEESS